MKPETSKLNRVVQSLRSGIEDNDFPKGSRLPGIRRLAKTFHVSYFTVHLAIQKLAKDGLLRCKPGSGAFVLVGKESGRIQGPKILAAAKRRAEALVDAISRDISSGAYRVGQLLPLKKALQFRYQTSLESLNAALLLARQRGLLHLRGRALIVGVQNTQRARHKNRIHLLPARGTSGERVWGSSLNRQFHFAFGKEIADYGLTFLGERRGEGFVHPDRRKNTLGFLVASHALNWAERVAGNSIIAMKREIRRFNRLGFPVVLYNCVSVFNRFPNFDFAKYNRVFAFENNSFIAGESVGAYLGMMGHTHIAFFNYSREFWNAERLDGVRKGLRSVVGEHGRVVEFGPGVDKTTIPGKAERGKSDQDGDLKKLISAWYPHLDFVDQVQTGNALTAIKNQISGAHHGVALRPFFERALQNTAITAWIGSDPTVAAFAKRFLAEKGENGSNRISLITIDDTELSADSGITACDLGQDRVGYLATHCLLGDIPIRKNEKGVVECPCRIVERGSVRRV